MFFNTKAKLKKLSLKENDVIVVSSDNEHEARKVTGALCSVRLPGLPRCLIITAIENTIVEKLEEFPKEFLLMIKKQVDIGLARKSK